MRYCEKCKVSLTGTPQRCPLCQGDLMGEPDGENAYPDIAFGKKPYWLPVRLLAFGTVVAAAVCIAINYSLPSRGWWSIFVVAGLISAWVTVGITLKKRKNPLKTVLWEVCVVSLLAIVWDVCTGFLGWSLDFVLPIMYTCTMPAVRVIAQIMHLRAQDYLTYLVLGILAGLIPLILVLCGVLHVIYPSVISVAVSAVFFVGVVLFEGNALKNELIRRLHL